MLPSTIPLCLSFCRTTPQVGAKAAAVTSPARDARGGGGGGRRSPYVAALQLLSDYLVDEDVAIIRTAQNTLRGLLNTAEGVAALEHVDACRPYIEIFAKK